MQTTAETPAMRFAWMVSGTALSSSPNATERSYEDSGTVEAEGVGEVVEWLAASGPVWDCVDQDCEMTIKITPLYADAMPLPSYLCQPVGCAGTPGSPCPNRTCIESMPFADLAAAKRRGSAITSLAELDARAVEIASESCPSCGAPAEWRTAFGCPEGLTEGS